MDRCWCKWQHLLLLLLARTSTRPYLCYSPVLLLARTFPTRPYCYSHVPLLLARTVTCSYCYSPVLLLACTFTRPYCYSPVPSLLARTVTRTFTDSVIKRAVCYNMLLNNIDWHLDITICAHYNSITHTSHRITLHHTKLHTLHHAVL